MISSRPKLLVLAFTPYVALSLLHLGAKLAGLVELDRATKGLLLPALGLGVVAVLLLGRLRMSIPVTAALLAGIALSWLGDITLTDFTTGLTFFLAAHVAYIVVFHLAFRRRASWWSVGVIPWYAALLLSLWPYLGDSRVSVALYGAALGYMAVAATRGNAFTTLGGALFVASDSLLAFRMFTPLFQTPPEDALIMALYLAAQLCIAVGVLRTAVRRPAAVPART
jgi:uncharacterized membrane protein YhhN